MTNGSGTISVEGQLMTQADQKFSQIEQDAAPLVARSKALMVKDEATQAMAAEIVSDMKRLEERAEEGRTFFTKPLNLILKGINDAAKGKMAALVEAKSALVRKMGAYQLEREAAERKEREKQQAKIEKAIENDKPIPTLKPIEETAKTVQTAYGSSVTMKSVWRFEILDPSKIPAAFLMPDEKKIGAYVRSMKADAKIPGIKVFEDKTAAVR